MSNIYGELFEDLPQDINMASYVLLVRIEDKILKNSPDEASYSAACGVLSALYEANNWKIPSSINTMSFGVPQPESIDKAIEKARATWRLKYEAYRNQIMGNRSAAVKQRAKEALNANMAGVFGYAILSEQEKNDIQGHVEQIRKIIEASKLDDRKKNALFETLSELSRDVNRNGTRTDRFFAFASELGFCLGDFAKKAKPLFDEVKAMLKILTQARARDENIKLPTGGEVLSLPEPELDNSEVA
jgi:hypothetical protein